MIHHPRELNRPHLLRHEAGPLAPATPFEWTPPLRTHIEVVSIYLMFDTDANAANRQVQFLIASPLDHDAIGICTGFQVANTSYQYWFMRGFPYDTGAPGLLGWAGGLPMGLIIQAPELVRSDIQNAQAGDVINRIVMRYYLWQDPVA